MIKFSIVHDMCSTLYMLTCEGYSGSNLLGALNKKSNEKKRKYFIIYKEYVHM